MAVKIRMTRTGAKNAAAFRIVAADSRSPRDGRFFEILGWYNPKKQTGNFDLQLDRVDYWVAQGAVVSDTVKSLVKQKLAGADTVAATPEPEADEVAEATTPVAEEAPAADPTADAEAEPAAEAVPESVKAEPEAEEAVKDEA